MIRSVLQLCGHVSHFVAGLTLVASVRMTKLAPSQADIMAEDQASFPHEIAEHLLSGLSLS